jgi:hypothetical protein
MERIYRIYSTSILVFLLFSPGLCWADEGSQSCTASASTSAVSLGENIQIAINNAPAGTALIFRSGTYRITSGVSLKSGVTLQGQSGVTFQYAGPGPSMLMGLGVSNINICGINFDGGPSGGSGDFPNAAIFIGNSTNIHIANNSFTNNSHESDLMFFNSDYIYFQGNTSVHNEYEPVSGHITDGGGHGYIYVTDNTFSDWARMATELGPDGPNQPWNDVHIDGNTFGPWGQSIDDAHIGYAVSLVNFPTGGRNNTIWGNTFSGTSGYAQVGIEIGQMNTSIEQNTMTNVDFPVIIASVPGTEIENNSFSSFSGRYTGTPFGYDGGYNGTEWIGTNLWNGTPVTGWPGHTYGTQPLVNQPSTPFQPALPQPLSQ